MLKINKYEFDYPIKIRVSPENRIKIQKILFKNNCKWIFNEKKVITAYIDFIFIALNGYMSYLTKIDEDEFINAKGIEVSENIFLKKTLKSLIEGD